ncbi:MAG: RNA polymerase sigma factor [Pseudobacter sp.]|uniref:RNA polymerase sigma factor n=1 Tax=Pseudobacter sp. TaxID=2045420 RepID=UPI003F7FB008
MSENYQYNEQELLLRITNGDQRAFRHVFDNQLNPLCYFAEKLIGQKQDAEDMVSQAFSKLWQRHKDFSSIAGIRSFLYTTVRNQCLDYLKHKAVVHAAEKHLQPQLAATVIEANMYQAELIQLIWQEIRQLPEKYRSILEYSFLEELSTAEIAKRLNKTETHVRVDKSRALVLLRAALRKKKVWEQAFAFLSLWQIGR